MVKQRESHRVIVPEFAQKRIDAGLCPTCEKPKSEFLRKGTRCCSPDCRYKYTWEIMIFGWGQFRERVFKRDDYTCAHCSTRITKPVYDFSVEGVYNQNTNRYDFQIIGYVGDASKLVADHIVPIAMGGDQWDMQNVQSLCIVCNKKKTANDAAMIAILRKQEAMSKDGQLLFSKDSHKLHYENKGGGLQ